MPHDDCSKEQDKAWGFYALWELLSHRFDELEHNLNKKLAAIAESTSADDQKMLAGLLVEADRIEKRVVQMAKAVEQLKSISAPKSDS